MLAEIIVNVEVGNVHVHVEVHEVGVLGFGGQLGLLLLRMVLLLQPVLIVSIPVILRLILLLRLVKLLLLLLLLFGVEVAVILWLHAHQIVIVAVVSKWLLVLLGIHGRTARGEVVV